MLSDPYPLPPPARPGRFWFYLSIFLGLGLVCSGLLILLLSVAVAGSSADKNAGYTVTLVDGEETEKDFIAIVPIQGMIMEPPSDNPSKGSLSQLSRLLRQLRKQERLKGILLMVDSPGGGVTTSDRMLEELRRFKADKKVPVVAVFEDVAASGGYYVAMAADHIMAHPTSITGSIGVISHFYDVSQLMGRVGVEVNTIKSLNFQGKESFKDIGSPYRKMRPEERELMQKLITEMWERFVTVVAEGRKDKLTLAEIRKLADGRVFSGQEALRQSLIDQVGYLPDAYQEIRKRCGSNKAKIVRYLPEKSWQDLFSAQAEHFYPKLELPSSRILYLWEPHS
ncbi:signal peptide peptidase SppA [bacterium]|nr:signal peptide peptidase SppA [bacterium]